MTITANIVDIINSRCFYGDCFVEAGQILSIQELSDEKPGSPYLMPGFIDAHVHIESSMLVPTEFARLAVRHGTVATVSDPHEIANVLGIEGVEYMLKNAVQTPFKFYFGVPSCVPATKFETAGDTLDANAVRKLLQRDELCYLAEMMNYPGVIYSDPEVIAKIDAAKEIGKPIDGHAPGLTGDAAITYINAGISTDHECVSYEEALHKLQHGMKIIIRDGSAAKNFEALHRLISAYPDMVMLCSDDKHPDDLVVGHINKLAARAIAKGHRWPDILRAGCVNPVLHYGLQVGLLQSGDPADMILVRDLESFDVLTTYIDGVEVFSKMKVRLPEVKTETANRFSTSAVSVDELRLEGQSDHDVRIIHAIDGSLITGEMHARLPVSDDGYYLTDRNKDILKIVVVNRYEKSAPAIAFIHGFGLKKGAIASSVAHDSHNIVAVGVDDKSLVQAINLVIAARGGIAAVDARLPTGTSHEHEEVLALPIAGIISGLPGEEVAKLYTRIDHFSKAALGSTLKSPFMTLSFMALLVIPQLKLSDKGLFDGGQFRFVRLEVE
ncbi:MAG TPA: adenine deaminase [Saprospiraceae bacterium]|nr:adenine deaminase [Saprospiraceae bacterium]